MTHTARLMVSVNKEIRGVWVAWLASVAAMIAAGVSGRGWGLGVPAYFLGAAALGALSIGHEYSHHTIALQLSQPARRERLFLLKLGVLAAMLLMLAVVAGVVLFYSNEQLRSSFGSQRGARPYVLALLWMPAVYSLFVAPWLTMVCRSPIAGTVFTIAIPGLLLMVGEGLGMARYGHTAKADGLRMAALWWGTLGACAVGAILSWRMFMRLEAIEGPGPDIGLPLWLRWRSATSTSARALTKRRPLWLLVKKELRLQQMALAVAGLYLLGWLTMVLPRYPGSYIGTAFALLTFFYGGLISVLIGSLASAEERQLGTLEWQLLLPMATSKQWAAKVGVALGLALPLAIGLPLMLACVSATVDMGFPMVVRRFGVFSVVLPQVTLLVILITASSLYVSSLCSSGLRALLMSLLALLGAALFTGTVVEQLRPSVLGFALRLLRGIAGRGRVIGGTHLMPFDGVLALFLAGFLAVVLQFGLTNHRSSDRPAGRVLKQAVWIAGCLALGVVLLTVLDDLARLVAY